MSKLSLAGGLSSLRHSSMFQSSLMLKLVGSLGSGVVSALSLTAIASQRIGRIDAETAVTLLLFIQWQVMALTVAKLGIDQVIFSVVSQDRTLRFAILEFLWKRTLPIAALSALVIGAAFSPVMAIIAAFSVVLDTFSVMVSADLNAREKFGATALGNLLNYPVFFVLLLMATSIGQDVEVLAVLFLISSATRASWLVTRYVRERAATTVQFRGAPTLAAQQALNYVLFRGDQLLLALIPAAGIGMAASLQRDEYVYLAKFPELAAGGLVIFGFFLFPRLRLEPDFLSVRLSVQVPIWLWLVLVGLTASLVVAFALYTSTLVAPDVMGDERTFAVLLPFLLQAVLALPVNALTYVFLGQGHATNLVKYQLVAVASAAALGAIAFQGGNLVLLAWVVPIQLLVFVLIAVCASVRSTARRPLFVAQSAFGTDGADHRTQH